MVTITSSGDATKFEGWAILELMGHRRLGGYVREQEIAGHGMLRIDVPSEDCADCGHPTGAHTSGGMCSGAPSECRCVRIPPMETKAAATQFYAPSALYCLTPTTEEMARAVAKRNQPAPVTRWELPPAPIDEDDGGRF